MDAKQELIEIFEFLIYKIRNNRCTPAELREAADLFAENLPIDATLEDLANFYGKSRDAVSSLINRRLAAKPKRNVVLYPFHKFRKIVPSSWRSD